MVLLPRIIKKINGLKTSLDLRLPMEAEWSMPAGRNPDPLLVRDNITPEQVNYNGLYPYAGVKKGSFVRDVEVKSLPCNSWDCTRCT